MAKKKQDYMALSISEVIDAVDKQEERVRKKKEQGKEQGKK